MTMDERDHLSVEQISAFVDEALSQSERDQARMHIDTCATCAAQVAQTRSVARLVAGLGDVEVDADAHRAIRQAVLERANSAPARRWRLAVASGTALLIVAGGAWFTSDKRQPANNSVVGLGPASASRSFETEAEVRDAVIKDPSVVEGLQSYRVRDVGETQSRLAGGSATSAEQRLESGGGSGDAAKDESGPVSVPECLNRVIASQPYPMVPLIMTDARFKGTPAWLFVFAWTTSTADDARLDRLQIWLVERDDCGTLSFSQLKP